MRISRSQDRNESGSVLVTTMVITFVLGATLASFLALTKHQVFSNSRSQAWNHTLAVSEAGVDDALQMINRYADDPNRLLEWATDINAGGSGADAWVNIGNDTYRTARTIGRPAQARYDIFVTNRNTFAPVIRAEGRLLYDHAYAQGTAGSLSSQFRRIALERTVVVKTRRDALWTMAMLADLSIDLKGNNISTDSFDSADPNASAYIDAIGYGTYDPTKSKDNGDVATNSGLVDSLNIGNADIQGYVSTGPGGSVEVGANGSVGSDAWVSGGNTGIEPGYASDDMNVQLNDVTLPETTWFTGLPTFAGTGTNINGIDYKHVLTTSGDYRVSTLQGGLYVAPGVQARVHFTDNVNLDGEQRITIHPAAQRLTVYMGGTRFKATGGGIVNETGNASSFLYFGLPTNTQIQLGGNAAFIGAIYANYADLTLGGGGSDTQDFIGAVVARSIKMNGHFNFHYDEHLATLGPSRGFIPTGWAEL